MIVESKLGSIRLQLIALIVGVGCCAEAADNLLENGSFETPAAVSSAVAGAPGSPWIGFNIDGSRLTTREAARSGLQSVKTIGPFDFIGGGAGGQQRVPASAGWTYTGQIFALNSSSDPVQGRDFGFMSITFLNESFQLVNVGFGNGVSVPGLNNFESTTRILAGTPRDTWTPIDTSGVAPAGTKYAQFTFAKIQLGNGFGAFVGGSLFWDDATLVGVPEPGAVAMVGAGLWVLGWWRWRVAEHCAVVS